MKRPNSLIVTATERRKTAYDEPARLTGKVERLDLDELLQFLQLTLRRIRAHRNTLFSCSDVSLYVRRLCVFETILACVAARIACDVSTHQATVRHRQLYEHCVHAVTAGRQQLHAQYGD